MKTPKRESVPDLWRISPFKDLSGKGGYFAAGRWHTQGRPISYLAGTPTGAMLETLVHVDLPEGSEPPETYQLLRAHFDDEVSLIELTDDELQDDWEENTEYTQELGNQWLSEGQSLLLRIPSRVMPYSNNYLLNPEHPDAELAKVEAQEFPYDPRLLKNR